MLRIEPFTSGAGSNHATTLPPFFCRLDKQQLNDASTSCRRENPETEVPEGRKPSRDFRRDEWTERDWKVVGRLHPDDQLTVAGRRRRRRRRLLPVAAVPGPAGRAGISGIWRSWIEGKLILNVVDPFHRKSHSSKRDLFSFLEICYKARVIGRFSKITIKPGFGTKPEFCTNGSKRYLTGGQYYKIRAFWWPLAVKKSGFTVILFLTANYNSHCNFSMIVT